MKSHEEFLRKELLEKLILQKQIEAYLDSITEKHAKTKTKIEEIDSRQIEGCIDLCYRYYLSKREKAYDKQIEQYKIRCEALEYECGLLNKHLQIIDESKPVKEKTSKPNTSNLDEEATLKR